MSLILRHATRLLRHQGYYKQGYLLHQGVSRLLRHNDVDQSQNISKSADFRCEKNVFLLIGES